MAPMVRGFILKERLAAMGGRWLPRRPGLTQGKASGNGRPMVRACQGKASAIVRVCRFADFAASKLPKGKKPRRGLSDSLECLLFGRKRPQKAFFSPGGPNTRPSKKKALKGLKIDLAPLAYFWAFIRNLSTTYPQRGEKRYLPEKKL